MKSVVFTFGRMNPPTTGHQLLVNKLLAFAHSSRATPRVYLSHTVGKKDPLPYDKKIAFARAAFGAIVRRSTSKNVIQILKGLEEEGFTHVTMFAGSDRVPEFTRLLNAYNGKEYNFEKIDIKSAGERDPDADDVSGMSASKMRALAKDENVAEFLRGAPNTLKAAQAKSMYNAVRKALLGEDVMDYGHDERFVDFMVEASDDGKDISIPSDAEIAKHIDDMSIDDLDLDDADALMLDVILGQDVDEKENVNEAKSLSIQTRQKLSQRMKAMSKRLARLRDVKRKQMPGQQRLRTRARKAALMILRRRATGKTNLDYNSLSRSQRVAVDNALVNRFGKGLNSAVDRISKRILPMIRKKAETSVAKARDIKEQTIDPKTKKHVPDQSKDNPLNVDATKLNILTTDPQKNDRVAPDPEKAHLYKNRKASQFFKKFDEGRKSSADKDARDAGDTNIIYQMRKTINSRGEHETTFADGNKSHISIADAKKMIAKFESLRMPADKQEFTIQASKSLAKFREVMAHGVKSEKKKISLGGKKLGEFNFRISNPHSPDEPPGLRRTNEAAKDDDAPEDPNRSRPLSQKLDLLLRLGLADTDELQKYRRALRSSKKAALQSPEMRAKLADLLDKLIDITTQDPTTYSRIRYRVQTKEAMSLLNKAEKSGINIDIIAEVFVRELDESNDTNRAFNRVNSFIAGGRAAELDSDLLEKRGLWDNIHAKRARIKAGSGERMRKPGSKGAPTDAAIKASQTEDKDPCWSDYKQVGMKMKGGRQVPNCVPKEEVEVNEISKKTLASYTKKAGKQVNKNQPADPDKLRKRTNREKGIKQAYGKYHGYKVKVSATEQNMTTHDAVPLSKRVKRVKSFHAFHPPVKEAYTGSEPTSSNMADPANRFVGTDAIRRNYASVTPGQEQAAGQIGVAAFSPEKPSYGAPIARTKTEVDHSKNDASKKHFNEIRKALGGIRESYDLNESFAAGFELAPFARDYGMSVHSTFEHHPEVQAQLDAQEATYQGRQVPLNKPMAGDVKKSKVFVDPDGDGKAKKVNFGDKKLSIKKDQPARKRSYCARSSGQGNLKNKASANYWSRRAWDC